MVVVLILPYAEFGPTDHREDAPHFTRAPFNTNKFETVFRRFEYLIFKEASRRTLDELDGFKTEFENGKSIADRLSRELFETRYSTSSKINDQEESIINLERQIR